MKWLLYIWLMMVCYSCGDPVAHDLAIAKVEVQIKVDQHRKSRTNECRAEALLKAEEIVDSIILTWDLNPIDDTLYRPTIPDKPKYIPVDTSVFKSESSVKPVLDHSVNKG